MSLISFYCIFIIGSGVLLSFIGNLFFFRRKGWREKYINTEDKYRLTSNAFIFLGFLLTLFSLFYEANSEIIEQHPDFFASICNSIQFQKANQISLDDFPPEDEDLDEVVEYIIVIDKSKSIPGNRAVSDTDSIKHIKPLKEWYEAAVKVLRENNAANGYEFKEFSNVSMLELYKIKAASFLNQLELRSTPRAQIYTLSERAVKFLEYKERNDIGKLLRGIAQSESPTEDVNSDFTSLFTELNDLIEIKKNSQDKQKLKLIIFSDLLHDIDGDKDGIGSLIDERCLSMNTSRKDIAKRICFEENIFNLNHNLEKIAKSGMLTNVVLLSKSSRPDEDDYSMWLGDIMKMMLNHSIHITNLEEDNALLKTSLVGDKKISFFYRHENRDKHTTSIKLPEGGEYRIGLSEMQGKASVQPRIIYAAFDSSNEPCTYKDETNPSKNKNVEGVLFPNGILRSVPNCATNSNIQLTYHGFPIKSDDKLPQLFLHDKKNMRMHKLQINFVKIFPWKKATFIVVFGFFIIFVTWVFIIFIPGGYVNLLRYSSLTNDVKLHTLQTEVNNKIDASQEEVKKALNALQTELNKIDAAQKGVNDKLKNSHSEVNRQLEASQKRVDKKLELMEYLAHLPALFEEVRIFASLSSGEKPDIQKERVAFYPFIKRLLKSFSIQAEARQIKFNLSYKIGEDLFLFLDMEKVAIIIKNLLSNALKHTPEQGSIDVSIWYPSEFDKSQIIIQIIDTGPGIQGEDVFSPYKSKWLESAGIGLSVAKYFAELMDGKMTAKNNRNGRGCTFTFSFPKVLPEENQEDSQKNAS